MAPVPPAVPILPSRRTSLAGLAAFASLPALATARAQGTAFSAISVDVGPLLARGLGPYAERVRSAVAAACAAAFADRIAAGGPRLVVRIDAVTLSDYAGGGSGRLFGTSTPTDYMEGEALVVDRRGGVVSRLPQLSAVPASSGGAYYLPDNEQRRLVALSEHFAGWLRRRLA